MRERIAEVRVWQEPNEPAQKWAQRVAAVAAYAHDDNLGGKHGAYPCEACADAALVAQVAVRNTWEEVAYGAVRYESGSESAALHEAVEDTINALYENVRRDIGALYEAREQAKIGCSLSRGL